MTLRPSVILALKPYVLYIICFQGTLILSRLDRLMTHLRTLVNATGMGILAIVYLKRPPEGETYNIGKE